MRITYLAHRVGALAGRGSAITASLVTSVLCACVGVERGPDPIRTDSAGVEIVVSGGVDRPLAWTFEQIARIGGEADGPASFTSVGPANVGVDAAGNVYVMDGDAQRVVVYDSDGRHLRTMGSGGEGPGELGFPIGMAVSPDGVAAVFDIGKRTLVRYGPDGGVLPEVHFPYSTEPGVHRFYALTDRHYVVARGFGGGRERSGRDLVLTVWPRTGSTADTVAVTRIGLPSPDYADFGCMRIAFQKLFRPLVQWDVQEDVIAVVDSERYEVDLYRFDGTPVRSVRRDVPPMPATRELALAEVANGLRMSGGGGTCEATAEEVVEARGFEDVVPALANVALAPGGEVWVERYRAGSSVDGIPGRIDVLDATGEYLGTLPEGTPFPLAFLSDDRVAISERDALDVERLVILSLDRRGRQPT